MKRFLVLVGLVAILALGLFAAFAVANDKPKPGTTTTQKSGNDNEHNKVTLCHATGSTTNPYVVITVDANGAINGHAGSSHQGGRDIIPPFSYNNHGKTVQVPGQNYDSKGQAALANGCKSPQPPATTIGTTTTAPSQTVTVTTPTVTTPGSTVTTTVTGRMVTTPTTTVKVSKPPVKVQPKPHLPKPPVKTKVKPSVFPYTP